MKKLLFIALMATSALTAQTIIPSNIVKATNGSLLLQGTNSSGTPTQSVAISNVGHIDARSANFNGSDGVSAQKLTLSNGGTISGSGQVVTIDAVGNGNVVIKDQTTIEGNLRVNQTISSSQTIMTTGTGSISSAYNLSAASNKFNVAGDNGNVRTTGNVSASSFGTNSGNFNVNGTNGNILTTGLINANGKATIDASNGNIWASGTTTAQGGLKVFNGASITGGLDVQNGKITKVANGTAATDAVNKGQLDLEVNRLNANLEFTNENVRENTINITNLQNLKADKFQVELDIEQAKNEAITTSNAYTDTKVGALETKINTEVTRLDDRINNLDSKVNTEVSRLDDRIDATNQNVTNLSNRVTTEVARVDGRIDATNKNVSNLTNVVEANKKEAADATAKVQSNLDKESKRLDMKIDTEIQKVESKFNQRITELDTRLNNRIDAVMTYVGNEFKAVNNRIEGLGASMVALSAAATSSVYNANKPTNVNIGTGFYGRSTAIAVGMSHFFNSSTKVSVNWAQGSHTKNAVGIGAGFAF
jgi:hypothetical protein